MCRRLLFVFCSFFIVCHADLSIEDLGQSVIYSERGDDELRDRFVTTQAAIEHSLLYALQKGEVSHLVGIIHTPAPCTPLCVEVDEKSYVSPLGIVRATLLRSLLTAGARLYIAYPKGGLEKRNFNQQCIYYEALEQYSEQLVNCVLQTVEMPEEMIGATYLFMIREQIYAFSITASQIDQPVSDMQWSLWLGALSTPQIEERVNRVLNYLESVEGPSIREEFGL